MQPDFQLSMELRYSLNLLGNRNGDFQIQSFMFRTEIVFCLHFSSGKGNDIFSYYWLRLSYNFHVIVSNLASDVL